MISYDKITKEFLFIYESEDKMKKFYDVEEKVPLLQGIPLSLQHLFAMFGSTVLVPFYFM